MCVHCTITYCHHTRQRDKEVMCAFPNKLSSITDTSTHTNPVKLHNKVFLIVGEVPVSAEEEKTGCDMRKLGTLDDSDETAVILRDRWPQTAEQERDKISKRLLWNVWVYSCMGGKS